MFDDSLKGAAEEFLRFRIRQTEVFLINVLYFFHRAACGNTEHLVGSEAVAVELKKHVEALNGAMSAGLQIAI